MKNLRNRWDRVYHDSLGKVEGPKRLLRENVRPQISAASRLMERSLRYGFHELFSTLSVTAYHPMGWSWQYFRERVENSLNPQRPEAIERQLGAPVLLVHGISHNSSAFYRFKSRAKKLGFHRIKTLEMFTTFKDLPTMTQQLRDEVERTYNEYRSEGGTQKVRIVSHSLGGMIVRAALLDPSLSEFVDRVIFLGVPHQGNFFYNFPIFPCIKDLTPHSALMQKIKSTPLPGDIEYWNIRGMLDVVTPSRDTFLPSVPNLSFVNVGHAGLLRDSRVLEAVLGILQEDSWE